MFANEPSYAHKALRSLEINGLLQGIITTNVDCMHTIAGLENVAEIQGSLQINPGKTNFDSYASLNIRAGADEVFRLIV
ncbi:MAG: hypothetical protein LUI13_00710 [Lachnospiraceae bacterium]|nr:hypothetical protein [Lachnospiraceae bacterium]